MEQEQKTLAERISDYRNMLMEHRFKDCEKLLAKSDGDDVMSLLLAATYIGQAYGENLPKASLPVEGGGWIKCSDRLPELPIVATDGSRFSGTVLVYRSKAPKHTCVGESQYGDYGSGDAGWLGESGQGVTHWMPLPTPPKSTTDNTEKR